MVQHPFIDYMQRVWKIGNTIHMITYLKAVCYYCSMTDDNILLQHHVDKSYSANLFEVSGITIPEYNDSLLVPDQQIHVSARLPQTIYQSSELDQSSLQSYPSSSSLRCHHLKGCQISEELKHCRWLPLLQSGTSLDGQKFLQE
jgi:hypothetical protein